MNNLTKTWLHEMRKIVCESAQHLGGAEEILLTTGTNDLYPNIIQASKESQGFLERSENGRS